jgi:hypothetical protein
MNQTIILSFLADCFEEVENLEKSVSAISIPQSVYNYLINISYFPKNENSLWRANIKIHDLNEIHLFSKDGFEKAFKINM